MKHLKLFENFNNPQEVLLGFYTEGGIGSHPAVFSPEVAMKMKELGLNFYVTSKEKELPKFLACIFNDNAQWDIKGIPHQIARSIEQHSSEGYVSTAKDSLELVNKIENMLGYPKSNKFSDTIITIIPNPRLNTIYWSNAPEDEHSYWKPPYYGISAEDKIREFRN